MTHREEIMARWDSLHQNTAQIARSMQSNLHAPDEPLVDAIVSDELHRRQR